MRKNKNKNRRRIPAWEMNKISESASAAKSEEFLLEAIETCKKRAELGYTYAEFENGLSVNNLVILGTLGYSHSSNPNGSVTIRWTNAKEPKKK